MKLTKTLVEHAKAPASGQAFLRDAEVRGLALRVTASGAKSFILEKRIEGRNKRITLGRYPDLTVEAARREALKLLGKIATGVNPVAEQRAAELKGVTLAQAFTDFLRVRKQLKARTIYDYRRLMTVAFSDWAKRSLTSISKDMVQARHQELGAARGKAYANLAMRFLRGLINFSMAQYEDGFGNAVLRENPVERLTRTRAWYRVERRQTVIKAHELPAWFAGVEKLRQDGEASIAAVVADYLTFVILTGMRRQEAARLKWDAVDLAGRTVLLVDTKNRRPAMLPLSDHLTALLTRRQALAASDFVFPGTGKHGYVVEPRAQIARVIAASGVAFTLHDLRRTFVTAAESLEISPYAVKRLVNHTTSGDVTAGYIVSDVERLRDPSQRITDFMLRAAGMRPSAGIVAFKPSQPVRKKSSEKEN